MHFLQSLVAVAALLSTSSFAVNIPSSPLEARDLSSRSNVDNCEADLRWHKASAFCSSFAAIKDATTTVYNTKQPKTTCTTKTVACTTPGAHQSRGKREASAKPVAAAVAHAEAEAEAHYGYQRCNQWGIPAYFLKYSCQDIKQACCRYVKPKTIYINDTHRRDHHNQDDRSRQYYRQGNVQYNQKHSQHHYGQRRDYFELHTNIDQPRDDDDHHVGHHVFNDYIHHHIGCYHSSSQRQNRQEWRGPSEDGSPHSGSYFARFRTNIDKSAASLSQAIDSDIQSREYSCWIHGLYGDDCREHHHHSTGLNYESPLVQS
ncbi:uncharacterized protein MYCGRDRAFT_96377 [Zymoseptoria tritici IPO323]|uniref:Ca2+-modulated nonselective cation channel polycystin n=1 Tax=Zymoseptoria tritici (strain CBS 115943 / IPO323) TaxID=336722 RepID=F9XLX6_ZYMTI|nr:uncharacterized protein MYCGRDRAFT_96377 [Zymoseptoria tritici IPO323]EGP84015.1 hypothetical protein MYCGRDRAFT_96377 [Zymoseptoria tritici IPO323]